MTYTVEMFLPFIIRQVGNERKKNVTWIRFINGLFRIEDLAAHINEKAHVFVLKNDLGRLRVPDGMTVSIDRR